MKPINADKNDPKVKVRNLLFGIQEKKSEGRVKLVMSLVSLLKEIELLPTLQSKVLRGYFDDVIEETNLTEQEKQLFNFEKQSFGI